MREAVVLVHGIWMTGLEMGLLGRRLARAGYTAHRFHYSSLRGTPARNAAALNAFLHGVDADVVHLVAHSLGGLVLCHLFNDFPEQRAGRVVMLGTPLRGSAVARHLARWRLTRWLLGRSIERGLLGDGPRWPGARPLAMIAGTRGGMGIGVLTATPLDHPHDGTVSVSETDAPEVRDHLQVPYGHFGLLLAGPVAAAVTAYLRGGRFRGD